MIRKRQVFRDIQYHHRAFIWFHKNEVRIVVFYDLTPNEDSGHTADQSIKTGFRQRNIYYKVVVLKTGQIILYSGVRRNYQIVAGAGRELLYPAVEQTAFGFVWQL